MTLLVGTSFSDVPPVKFFINGLARAIARKAIRDALRIKRISWRSLNFTEMRLLVCNIKSMAANLCEIAFFLFIRWMMMGMLAPRIPNNKMGLRNEIIKL
jgi:hypothetical protein